MVSKACSRSILVEGPVRACKAERPGGLSSPSWVPAEEARQHTVGLAETGSKCLPSAQ